MRLKKGFILHSVNDQHMAVATGKAGENFNGIIRNNETANFIFEQLMEDTTEEKIVEAMLLRYDAPKELIERDVKKVLAKLGEAGFLDE